MKPALKPNGTLKTTQTAAETFPSLVCVRVKQSASGAPTESGQWSFGARAQNERQSSLTWVDPAPQAGRYSQLCNGANDKRPRHLVWREPAVRITS
eukprot:5038117-Pleurochrysis_carterae.AAC.1